MACAFLMSMASIEVIQFSIVDLYNGFNGNIPKILIDTQLYIILFVGIALKLILYIYCRNIQVRKSILYGACLLTLD